MSDDRERGARDAHPLREVLRESPPPQRATPAVQRRTRRGAVDVGSVGHEGPTSSAFGGDLLSSLGGLDLSTTSAHATFEAPVQRRVVQRDQLDAYNNERTRDADGRVTDQDPELPARDRRRQVAPDGQWNGAEIVSNFTQVDGLSQTAYDAHRCGFAATLAVHITAGHRAVQRVARETAQRLERLVERSALGDMGRAAARIAASIDGLGLPERSVTTVRYDHLDQITEGLYYIGNHDQMGSAPGRSQIRRARDVGHEGNRGQLQSELFDDRDDYDRGATGQTAAADLDRYQGHTHQGFGPVQSYVDRLRRHRNVGLLLNVASLNLGNRPGHAVTLGVDGDGAIYLFDPWPRAGSQRMSWDRDQAQIRPYFDGQRWEVIEAVAGAGGQTPGASATREGVQRKSASDAIPASQVHQAAAHGLSGSGGQLPHAAAIQQSFGHHDVSSVSAHVGGRAAEGAAAMGATAYATGNDIAFASSPDLHTAAHEAAHIVQQRSGVDLPGNVSSTGDRYEQHADKVADKVVRGESAAGLLDQMSGGSGASGGVQRRVVQRFDPDEEARRNRIREQRARTRATIGDRAWNREAADIETPDGGGVDRRTITDAERQPLRAGDHRRSHTVTGEDGHRVHRVDTGERVTTRNEGDSLHTGGAYSCAMLGVRRTDSGGQAHTSLSHIEADSSTAVGEGEQADPARTAVVNGEQRRYVSQYETLSEILVGEASQGGEVDAVVRIDPNARQDAPDDDPQSAAFHSFPRTNDELRTRLQADLQRAMPDHQVSVEGDAIVVRTADGQEHSRTRVGVVEAPLDADGDAMAQSMVVTDDGVSVRTPGQRTAQGGDDDGEHQDMHWDEASRRGNTAAAPHPEHAEHVEAPGHTAAPPTRTGAGHPEHTEAPHPEEEGADHTRPLPHGPQSASDRRFHQHVEDGDYAAAVAEAARDDEDEPTGGPGHAPRAATPAPREGDPGAPHVDHAPSSSSSPSTGAAPDHEGLEHAPDPRRGQAEAESTTVPRGAQWDVPDSGGPSHSVALDGVEIDHGGGRSSSVSASQNGLEGQRTWEGDDGGHRSLGGGLSLQHGADGIQGADATLAAGYGAIRGSVTGGATYYADRPQRGDNGSYTVAWSIEVRVGGSIARRLPRGAQAGVSGNVAASRSGTEVFRAEGGQSALERARAYQLSYRELDADLILERFGRTVHGDLGTVAWWREQTVGVERTVGLAVNVTPSLRGTIANLLSVGVSIPMSGGASGKVKKATEQAVEVSQIVEAGAGVDPTLGAAGIGINGTMMTGIDNHRHWKVTLTYDVDLEQGADALRRFLAREALLERDQAGVTFKRRRVEERSEERAGVGLGPLGSISGREGVTEITETDAQGQASTTYRANQGHTGNAIDGTYSRGGLQVDAPTADGSNYRIDTDIHGSDGDDSSGMLSRHAGGAAREGAESSGNWRLHEELTQEQMRRFHANFMDRGRQPGAAGTAYGRLYTALEGVPRDASGNTRRAEAIAEFLSTEGRRGLQIIYQVSGTTPTQHVSLYTRDGQDSTFLGAAGSRTLEQHIAEYRAALAQQAPNPQLVSRIQADIDLVRPRLERIEDANNYTDMTDEMRARLVERYQGYLVDLEMQLDQARGDRVAEGLTDDGDSHLAEVRRSQRALDDAARRTRHQRETAVGYRHHFGQDGSAGEARLGPESDARTRAAWGEAESAWQLAEQRRREVTARLERVGEARSSNEMDEVQARGEFRSAQGELDEATAMVEQAYARFRELNQMYRRLEAAEGAEASPDGVSVLDQPGTAPDAVPEGTDDDTTTTTPPPIRNAPPSTDDRDQASARRRRRRRRAAADRDEAARQPAESAAASGEGGSNEPAAAPPSLQERRQVVSARMLLRHVHRNGLVITTDSSPVVMVSGLGVRIVGHVSQAMGQAQREHYGQIVTLRCEILTAAPPRFDHFEVATLENTIILDSDEPGPLDLVWHRVDNAVGTTFEVDVSVS